MSIKNKLLAAAAVLPLAGIGLAAVGAPGTCGQYAAACLPGDDDAESWVAELRHG